MSSLLELQASKVAIGASGQLGTKVILPLDVDKIVTSANMKVGAYTIAAQPPIPCRITVSVTAVGADDTMGTIIFVGTLADGTTIQETVTPIADETVSTINEFKTITSATGVGWIIGEGNDTLTIGIGEVIPNSYYFEAINNRVVTSANMKVGAYTIANQPLISSYVTATVTAVDTADTMGTITITGISDDIPTTEVLTPIANETVTSENKYSYIYSVVGAGWVIDAVEGTEDTIEIGTAETNVSSNYFISAIQILSAAVVSSQTAQTGHTVADLTQFTSIPVGIYPTRLTAVKFTSGEGIAYLQVI